MIRIEIPPGTKYGRLTVLQFVPAAGRKPGAWLCQCSCGNKKEVRGAALRSGHTVSCGCRSEECLKLRTTHGITYTKVYWTYWRMLDRCTNKNCPRYSYYGGRGISVCPRWTDTNGLHNFVSDMGHPPSPKHSIDRIDVNGNYEPANCRWATQSEQMKNRRPRKKVGSK